MFTFLDMINSSLGYFNMSVKVKNRIYTIVAFLGDLYLIYVTFMLLRNQSWLRGLLYCLAVVVITYYLYLNFVYYYLGRTSRWDFLSPKLTQITGFSLETPEEKDRKRLARREAMLAMNQSNGLYANEDVIQTEVKIGAQEQSNLRDVIDDLVERKLIVVDYNGLDAEGITEHFRSTGEGVPAVNKGQQPPFFELQHNAQTGQYEVYIGINQIERRPVGHITKVGLTDISAAAKAYELYLANVYITGGPQKMPGRSGSLILTDADFGLIVQVAYRDRDTQSNR